MVTEHLLRRRPESAWYCSPAWGTFWGYSVGVQFERCLFRRKTYSTVASEQVSIANRGNVHPLAETGNMILEGGKAFG